MFQANAIIKSGFTKRIAFISTLFAIIFAVQGCSHHQLTKNFGSHKITVGRHLGFTTRMGIEERGDVAVFHFEGYTFEGRRLKIDINNREEVTQNGDLLGKLKKGDEVTIHSNGLTVVSAEKGPLDFGDTGRYLQSNIEQASVR
ncbi:MAG: hypothetical protein WCB68_14590 [Pyrinomonadaceae bacterium]